MADVLRSCIVTAALLCVIQPLGAQTSEPVSTAARAAATRLAHDITAAVETFPADKFQYKPTPAQMSVAEVALHLAEDNAFGCSSLGGGKPPAEAKLAPTDDLAKIIASMKRSFDFCTSAFAQLHDTQMGDQVPFWGNRKGSRAEMVFEMQEDWADHYSQLANYLRLNGMLPPTARPQPK